MTLFNTWPEKIQGENIYIVRTTMEHLTQFLSWRQWEGNLELSQEETSFANQRERVRKVKRIKNLRKDTELALSIFTQDSELISLAELYLIEKEVYVSKWILKKKDRIIEYAYQTGELLLQYILGQKETEIDCILVAVQEYRLESISVLLNLGFVETGYYYQRNFKDKWIKMLTFRM